MIHTSKGRLLVTFALYAFNPEKYVRKGVVRALFSTVDPLEIILTDDRSRDRTFELMQGMAAAYEGVATIRLNKNSSKQRLAKSLNRAVEQSRGAILIFRPKTTLGKAKSGRLPSLTSLVKHAFPSTRG